MPRRSTASRHALIGLGLLALVAASVAATWVASSRIRSPAEAAARTTPPEPSPILVPVERRLISTEVITRGTGRFGSPQTLHAIPSALKPAPGYVDSVPAPGTELAEGDVAMVISGRPLIVLQGDQPAFRDLGPGLDGIDVLQLERALARLGFDPGPVDGTYDSGTEAAVAGWYRSLGYEAVSATSAQLAEIRSLEAELATIEREVVAANEGVAAASADLVAAQEAYRVATVAAADADAAAVSARAEADAAHAAALAEVDIAQGAVNIRWRTLPDIYAPAEEIDLAYAEWDNLRAAVEAAEANAELVRTTGEAAVRAAERAAAAAPGDVTGAAAAVAAAERRVELARGAVDLAESPVSVVEGDISVAEERAGVQVPADEVIFVPDVPVRVSESQVARGDQAVGPLLSVTDAVIAIDGTLALDEVALVAPGMQVAIREPDLAIEAIGVVRFVAAGPGTNGADGFHVWFETLVESSGTPATNVIGASVRLSLTVESTDGPVLTVPASAVTLTVGGSSSVLVERAGGFDTVTVEPGLSAAGYVAVVAPAGDLAEGDMVVIGFEQPVTPNG